MSLQTERLILRSIVPGDRDAVLELLTDAEAMHFIGPRRPLLEAEALSWFDELLHAQLQQQNRLAVALKMNNQLIGFCGVKDIEGVHDFGFFFRRGFWGHGYAREACHALLPVLWERFGDTLDIFIADANYASVRLASKLGLQRGKDTCRHGEAGAVYHYRPPVAADSTTVSDLQVGNSYVRSTP